jgi:hypothetical protein
MKDKVADARRAQLDAPIRTALENKLQRLEMHRKSPVIDRLELLVQDTLNTMNRPEP